MDAGKRVRTISVTKVLNSNLLYTKLTTQASTLGDNNSDKVVARSSLRPMLRESAARLSKCRESIDLFY